MKTVRQLGFMIFAVGLLMASARNAAAQVAVNIGEPPICPYG
jgi:hypothetical protein